MLTLLSSLSKSLMQHIPLTHPQFISFYPDWMKNLTRILCVQMTRPSPASLNFFKAVWVEFGTALGYKQPHQNQIYCSNPRCSGIEGIFGENFVRIKCSDATYCGTRCQNASVPFLYLIGLQT